jgi:hypothetical protein
MCRHSGGFGISLHTRKRLLVIRRQTFVIAGGRLSQRLSAWLR